MLAPMLPLCEAPMLARYSAALWRGLGEEARKLASPDLNSFEVECEMEYFETAASALILVNSYEVQSNEHNLKGRRVRVLLCRTLAWFIRNKHKFGFSTELVARMEQATPDS